MYRDPKYTTVTDEKFPPHIEIHFVDGAARQVLVFEKVTWEQGGRAISLRYGDNPGQPGALYRLINGNLVLGDVQSIGPGNELVSLPELLIGTKHPGKINITDADRALAHLRHLMDKPACVIIKHGNPSAIAHDGSLASAFEKAWNSDSAASFGGCVGFNRSVDKAAAEGVLASNTDVVVAPEYEQGVLDLLATRDGLRVLRIANMERLAEYAYAPVIDFRSLVDGGLVVQWSQVPPVIGPDDLRPAAAIGEGQRFICRRTVRGSERDDVLLAWKIVCAMSSNAAVFVKDGCTMGIATGQQDSLSATEVARDKAYRNLADRIALRRTGKIFQAVKQPMLVENIHRDVGELRGGLIGSVLASDGFFPSIEAIDLAAREGVIAVIQPGGATGDHKLIEECNEVGVAMVFTGQRTFVG